MTDTTTNTGDRYALELRAEVLNTIAVGPSVRTGESDRLEIGDPEAFYGSLGEFSDSLPAILTHLGAQEGTDTEQLSEAGRLSQELSERMAAGDSQGASASAMEVARKVTELGPAQPADADGEASGEKNDGGPSQDVVVQAETMRVGGKVSEHVGGSMSTQVTRMGMTVNGRLRVNGTAETTMLTGAMSDTQAGGVYIGAGMSDDLIAGGGMRLTVPVDLWLCGMIGMEEQPGTAMADGLLVEMYRTAFEREYGAGVHVAGAATFSGTVYTTTATTFRQLRKVLNGVRNLSPGGGSGGDGGGSAPASTPASTPAAAPAAGGELLQGTQDGARAGLNYDGSAVGQLTELADGADDLQIAQHTQRAAELENLRQMLASSEDLAGVEDVSDTRLATGLDDGRQPLTIESGLRPTDGSQFDDPNWMSFLGEQVTEADLVEDVSDTRLATGLDDGRQPLTIESGLRPTDGSQFDDPDWMHYLGEQVSEADQAGEASAPAAPRKGNTVDFGNTVYSTVFWADDLQRQEWDRVVDLADGELRRGMTDGFYVTARAEVDELARSYLADLGVDPEIYRNMSAADVREYVASQRSRLGHQVADLKRADWASLGFENPERYQEHIEMLTRQFNQYRNVGNALEVRMQRVVSQMIGSMPPPSIMRFSGDVLEGGHHQRLIDSLQSAADQYRLELREATQLSGTKFSEFRPNLDARELLLDHLDEGNVYSQFAPSHRVEAAEAARSIFFKFQAHQFAADAVKRGENPIDAIDNWIKELKTGITRFKGTGLPKAQIEELENLRNALEDTVRKVEETTANLEYDRKVAARQDQWTDFAAIQPVVAADEGSAIASRILRRAGEEVGEGVDVDTAYRVLTARLEEARDAESYGDIYRYEELLDQLNSDLDELMRKSPPPPDPPPQAHFDQQWDKLVEREKETRYASQFGEYTLVTKTRSTLQQKAQEALVPVLEEIGAGTGKEDPFLGWEVAANRTLVLDAAQQAEDAGDLEKAARYRDAVGRMDALLLPAMSDLFQAADEMRADAVIAAMLPPGFDTTMALDEVYRRLSEVQDELRKLIDQGGDDDTFELMQALTHKAGEYDLVVKELEAGRNPLLAIDGDIAGRTHQGQDVAPYWEVRDEIAAMMSNPAYIRPDFVPEGFDFADEWAKLAQMESLGDLAAKETAAEMQAQLNLIVNMQLQQLDEGATWMEAPEAYAKLRSDLNDLRRELDGLREQLHSSETLANARPALQARSNEISGRILTLSLMLEAIDAQAYGMLRTVEEPDFAPGLIKLMSSQQWAWSAFADSETLTLLDITPGQIAVEDATGSTLTTARTSTGDVIGNGVDHVVSDGSPTVGTVPGWQAADVAGDGVQSMDDDAVRWQYSPEDTAGSPAPEGP